MRTTNKRIWLGIRKKFGRNLSLFLLLVLMVSTVSGFLVAADSVLIKYNEIMRVGNVESGQFTTVFPLNKNTVGSLNKENVYIEEMPYFEYKINKNNKLRIYGNRKSINKPMIIKGKIAKNTDEITLNRLYAENNNINIGEKITISKDEFIDKKDRSLKVVGLVSTPDYNTVFSKNTDLMFDSYSFGIGIIDKKLMDKVNPSNFVYQTGYKINDEKKLSDKDIKSKNEEILNIVTKENVLMSFMTRDDNNAIMFMTDDMGGDKPMMLVFFCIMLSVISLVFLTIASSTINEEAEIIGTLMANGYRRRELIKLYLAGPVIISIISGIVGNVLGYTVMTKPMVSMYYKSFELPNFEAYFNIEAFLITTIIPIIIMLTINFVSLNMKLRYAPIKFIKGAINKNKRKISYDLPFKKFKTRFVSRVILKEKGDYIVMIIGVFISSLLLFYGLSINPTFEHYTKITRESLVSKYQYILKAPVEIRNTDKEKEDSIKDNINSDTNSNMSNKNNTINNVEDNIEGVEKITISSSQVYIPIRGEKEDVSIIGTTDKSKFFKNIKLSNEKNQVIVSESLCKKANIKVGDNIDVWDKFTGKKKTYKVYDVYNYPATLAIFMMKENLNDVINKDKNYFNAYLSDHKLDIDENFVATVIDESTAGDAGKQLKEIMGPLIGVFTVVSTIFFFVIMFMLSKLIMEKNSLNIAYLKIFGYKTKEIRNFYMGGSTVVLLISVFLGVPLELKSLEYISLLAMAKFNGYFEMTIDNSSIITAVIVPIIVYIVVVILQMKRISRMNFSEALKNRE